MRDIWAVVGAIAGVLAVAVAVVVFVLGRSEQAKALDVELVSRSILVDERLSQYEGRLELLYDGRKIPNYAILQLRVTNIGGQPIRTADYEVPVRFRFTGVEEILSAKQTAADPKELQIETEIKGAEVGVSAVLLNPRDSYVVDFRLVPRPRETPSVQPVGRIAGVKQIGFKQAITEARPKESDLFRYITLAQAGLVVIAMAFQFWSLWRRRLWRSG